MKVLCTLVFTLFTIALTAQENTNHSDNKETPTLNFKLYPNPSYDGKVYITTKVNAKKEIVIYDIFGALVLQEKIATPHLNVSKLAPGVYALQVTENLKVMTRKLVIK